LLWQEIPIVCWIGIERQGTLVSFLTLGGALVFFVKTICNLQSIHMTKSWCGEVKKYVTYVLLRSFSCPTLGKLFYLTKPQFWHY
jgi:hypothetical protein